MDEKTKYVADDGKEFETEKQAKYHEAKKAFNDFLDKLGVGYCGELKLDDRYSHDIVKLVSRKDEIIKLHNAIRDVYK